ncbi:MAG: SRPBCC family protein [Actinomycetota bacterium]
MSDATPDTDLGEVTFTRVLDAPRAIVFRAFIEPEHLTHFWGPAGTSTPLETIVIEARPGGRFETVMVNDADGTEYPTKGVFIEVVEPERLVFGDPDGPERQTITFTDLGGKTELTIHQEGLPAAYRTPESLEGFNSYLDKLAAYISEIQGGGA